MRITATTTTSAPQLFYCWSNNAYCWAVATHLEQGREREFELESQIRREDSSTCKSILHYEAKLSWLTPCYWTPGWFFILDLAGLIY